MRIKKSSYLVKPIDHYKYVSQRVNMTAEDVFWQKIELQANAMLGLRDSRHLLPVGDMHPSDSYQYILKERFIADKIHSKTGRDSDGQDEDAKGSILSTLDTFKFFESDPEDVRLIKDKIKDRVFELAREIATKRQSEVMELMLDGYKQMEMAQILGVNQSSIVKCIAGNVEYKNRKHRNGKKRYGGLGRKCFKALQKDEIYLSLKEQLNYLLSSPKF